MANQFEKSAPKEGKSMELLLKEVEEKILPYCTHWQHPQFFGYYPAVTSTPAIYSETIISAIASVGLQWVSNP